MKKYAMAVMVFSLMVCGSCLAGARPPQTSDQLTTAQVITDVLFNEAERRVLSNYLRKCADDERCRGEANNQDKKPGKKKKALPPGLKKKLERGGELPTGWQRKLARGEVLDDDLYFNHARSLPEEILNRLPARSDGSSIRQIDDRIVRINDATRTVLDVLYLTGW